MSGDILPPKYGGVILPPQGPNPAAIPSTLLMGELFSSQEEVEGT